MSVSFHVNFVCLLCQLTQGFHASYFFFLLMPTPLDLVCYVTYCYVKTRFERENEENSEMSYSGLSLHSMVAEMCQYSMSLICV